MLVVALLVGCSETVDIKLSRADISLNVGESRNIQPYVGFLPATAAQAVTLSATSDCVSIDGAYVTAVKPGTADITVSAHGKTATMHVSVSYKRVTDFSVITENTVQTTPDAPQPITMRVALDEDADPQTSVIWQADGATYAGSSFEYTPKGYGEHTVCVTVGDIQKQCVVRVYRRTDVIVKHTDVGKVRAHFPVVFTAYESVNTLNPKSVYEWRVNGECAGDSPTFSFTPQCAQYRVSLYVNGEIKKIDGMDEFVIDIARDGVADCFVDYDDVNGVYIRWDQARDVMYVSIIDPSGNRFTFDVTDAQHAHLFGNGSFRATEYIDVCALNPLSYTIFIGTDDGRIEFGFTQLSMDAKSYLDNKVFIKNSFISSDDDAREWVSELYVVGKVSAECYAPSGAHSIQKAVRDRAELLGLSAMIMEKGNVLELSLSPYANKPSSHSNNSANAIYAQLPHIAYDGVRRDSDYVFMSDRATSSVTVHGTEQLLVAVSNGVKPITQSTDVADSVYKVAKSILLHIIGAEYTPRQKVHAVYDWLQRVTVNVKSDDNAFSSRFLEGVFDSTRTCAVTSEGVSKAFSLLCGIEGIDCEVCRDKAYGYYNKVQLDGLWYNVDVYGGKIIPHSVSFGTTVELASHRGLLISDEQLEMLGCNANDGYEAFDRTNTEYMQKYDYNGAYFDYYIDRDELSYDTVRAAVYYAFNGTVRGNIRLPYVGSEVLIFNNTYGAEFELDSRMTEQEVITATAYINRAIDEYAKNVLNATFANRQMLRAGNIIVAIDESPRTVTE